MRLIQLKVTNFRCFKEETVVGLDNITALIGKNDSGKSSLFDAMDIFLDEKKVPETDDCCVHTKDSTVRIACVFDSLPGELVIDEQHPTDLASEYLLNFRRNLEIAKEYNCPAKGKGKLVSVFARANHPTAENEGHEFEDVPGLFAQAVHEASNSDQTWADIISDPEKLGKKVSNAKRRLCSEFVAKMTPDLLRKIDAKNEVRTWLKAIGAALNSG